MASDVCVERRRHCVLTWGFVSLATVLLAPVAAAEELRQPPVCSAATVDDFKPEGICEVTPLAGGRERRIGQARCGGAQAGT